MAIWTAPLRLGLLALLLVPLAACGEEGDTPSRGAGAGPEGWPPALSPVLAEQVQHVAHLHPEAQAEHVAQRIPSRHAFAQELLHALLHPDLTLPWQRKVRRVVAALGPPAAPAVLQAWLDAPDATAGRAYVALTSLLPDAGAWHAGGDPFARRWADEHRRALASFERPLLERIRRGRGTRRMHAGWILAALPPEARGVRSQPWLVDALVQPQEEELRRVAAHALVASAGDGASVVQRLWPLLDGPDADVRDMVHAILLAWGRVRPEVADRFAGRLRRAAPGPAWRQAVANVTQLGPLASRAAAALVDAWQQASGEDRARARRALLDLGPHADAALLDLATTGPAPWRARAVELLAAGMSSPSPAIRARLEALPEPAASQVAPRLARTDVPVDD